MRGQSQESQQRRSGRERYCTVALLYRRTSTRSVHALQIYVRRSHGRTKQQGTNNRIGVDVSVGSTQGLRKEKSSTKEKEKETRRVDNLGNEPPPHVRG